MQAWLVAPPKINLFAMSLVSFTYAIIGIKELGAWKWKTAVTGFCYLFNSRCRQSHICQQANQYCLFKKLKSM